MRITAKYAVDKHNLRYLLSNIPTRTGANTYVTTNLKAANGMGEIQDLRAIGGQTIITIGKSELEVNNNNGKVLKYKKPFFSSLQKLVDKATELITYISQNIKNSEKVEQTVLKIAAENK